MAQEHGSFIVLSPQPEFFPQGGVLALVSIRCVGKPSLFWITTSSNRTTAILICWGICCRNEGVKAIIHAQKPFFTRPAAKRCSNPS